MDIEEERKKLEQLLLGKPVKSIMRHRASELVIEFSDGTRFFIDVNDGTLEFSVTCGQE